jgi:Na+/proline symporter
MGPLLVTGSVFATWFGAETVVGASGRAHGDGVSIASAEPYAYGFCIVLMGLVFAAPLWRRKLTTLADLYRQRYTPPVERVAAIVLIPGSLFWAAAQIRAFGQVLVVSGAGVNIELALAIAAGFVILYTAVGGLLADATTDILQAGLLTLGLGVLLVSVVGAHGGVGETAAVIAAADKVHFLPTTDISFVETVEAWAIPVLGSVTATELISRVIGARSATVAKFGSLGAGAGYVAVGTISVLIGLAAGSLIGPVGDAEQIVPEAARTLLAPWMYIVFAGGFLAAILSTVDSTLLVSSGLFSHNLLLPVLRIGDQRTKLYISRGSVAVFGLIAYLISQRGGGVSEIVETASAFGSAGVLVTVSFGLFTPFGGAKAAMATLVVGIASYLAATVSGTATPFLISLGASFATYVIVGVLERNAATATSHDVGT